MSDITQPTSLHGEHIKPCPCCGTMPDLIRYRGDKGWEYMMTCPRNGCKQVIANTKANAVDLWNEQRFTERK
jgi:hypothetical protein